MNESDREILEHFSRTRNQTIELAQRVPEEFLSSAADGEDHRLDRLLVHIAEGVDWWMHHLMRDGRGWPPGYGRGKSSILDALGASRDRLTTFFEAGGGEPMGRTFSFDKEPGGPWSGRNRVLYLTDHEIHHRGKIVLALRQWGFTEFPPLR